MPFYEYECSNCKFYSELMQKISDPPLKKCPSCGKSTMKKLVSAPNFRLKGSGWYETDFKSDQENKRNLAADKEPEAAPAAEAKGDAKTEAKPAEAKDAKEAKEAKVGGESKPAESKPGATASAGNSVRSGRSGKSAAISRRPSVARRKSKPKVSAKRPRRR